MPNFHWLVIFWESSEATIHFPTGSVRHHTVILVLFLARCFSTIANLSYTLCAKWIHTDFSFVYLNTSKEQRLLLPTTHPLASRLLNTLNDELHSASSEQKLIFLWNQFTKLSFHVLRCTPDTDIHLSGEQWAVHQQHLQEICGLCLQPLTWLHGPSRGTSPSYYRFLSSDRSVPRAQLKALSSHRRCQVSTIFMYKGNLGRRVKQWHVCTPHRNTTDTPENLLSTHRDPSHPSVWGTTLGSRNYCV